MCGTTVVWTPATTCTSRFAPLNNPSHRALWQGPRGMRCGRPFSHEHVVLSHQLSMHFTGHVGFRSTGPAPLIGIAVRRRRDARRPCTPSPRHYRQPCHSHLPCPSRSGRMTSPGSAHVAHNASVRRPSPACRFPPTGHVRAASRWSWQVTKKQVEANMHPTCAFTGGP